MNDCRRAFASVMHSGVVYAAISSKLINVVEHMTSSMTETQCEDLKSFAESINASEASYGAIILRMIEENTRLRSEKRPPNACDDVLVDTINNTAEENSKLRAEKNNAYSERDMLVCAFVKLAVVMGWESWIGPHDKGLYYDGDGEWDPEWCNVIYVETPHGQVSWHVHDSEVEWFSFLPRHETPGWDGHTSVEKYARLGVISVEEMREGVRSLLAEVQMKAAEEAQATLSRKLEHLTSVATRFVRRQSEVDPDDFASIEFDMLERALGLREITPDAVIQERLHQEIDRPSEDQ